MGPTTVNAREVAFDDSIGVGVGVVVNDDDDVGDEDDDELLYGFSIGGSGSLRDFLGSGTFGVDFLFNTPVFCCSLFFLVMTACSTKVLYILNQIISFVYTNNFFHLQHIKYNLQDNVCIYNIFPS